MGQTQSVISNCIADLICKLMGQNRASSCRLMELYHKDGEFALHEISRES